jgi:hypothetical protein
MRFLLGAVLGATLATAAVASRDARRTPPGAAAAAPSDTVTAQLRAELIAARDTASERVGGPPVVPSR